MKDGRVESGNTAEFAAVEYLEKKGYEILDTNWRKREGEIDIIAGKTGCFHFIEVKSRATHMGIDPLENWSVKQRERFFVLVETYIAEHPKLFDDTAYEISLDFIGVEISEKGEVASIEHLPDALRPS